MFTAKSSSPFRIIRSKIETKIEIKVPSNSGYLISLKVESSKRKEKDMYIQNKQPSTLK